MQRCPLTPEVVGRRTAIDVLSPQGAVILVPAGVRLAEQDVQALISRGVQHVFLRDELFLELPEVHTVPVRSHLEAQAALGTLTAALAAARSEEPATELQRLLRAARGLVEEIVAADAGIADLGPWNHASFDLLEHAVDVAAIAVQIGRSYSLPRDQLLRLCVGSLLMDVGLSQVPPGVLRRPGPLDAIGVSVMLGHPRQGWQTVHRWLPAVLPTSASVVLQHHERLDGSGYPEGRQGQDIYLFARIAAVADVFAAIRSDRPHRRRFRPAEIVRLLQEESDLSLDREACDGLLHHVAVVPHGAIVRLTDGSLAKVVAHSMGAQLQPLCVVVGGALDQPVRRRQVNLRGTSVYVDQVLDSWPRAFVERLDRGPSPWLTGN